MSQAMSPGLCSMIERKVMAFYGLSPKAFYGHSKKRKYARPRQMAMYLEREIAKKSLPEIGRRLDKDHTTVLHAVRRIRALAQTDVTIFDQISDIRVSLEPYLRDREEKLAAIAIADGVAGLVSFDNDNTASDSMPHETIHNTFEAAAVAAL